MITHSPPITAALAEHPHIEVILAGGRLYKYTGEVVAPASSEKLGTAGPFVIGPLSELNTIVTDQNVSEDTLQVYRKFGIEIITV